VKNNQTVDLILEALKREFNPLRAFMFGSRVTGNVQSESDYDFVLVVEKTDKTRIENMRRARALVREVAGVSADVFVYNQKEFDEYKDELSSIPETAVNMGRELDLGRR
jgi:predicted nucleotidyltransferase